MKYLLAAIDARRSVVPLDDAELRKLLTDVRKSKDDKSEMNEAMERLITELKGSVSKGGRQRCARGTSDRCSPLQEHATAFLTRVSKREAPDYYEVIKHPMDLGTMLRNVKASKYKNKNAFAADLELIWSNCEMYNMLPVRARCSEPCKTAGRGALTLLHYRSTSCARLLPICGRNRAICSHTCMREMRSARRCGCGSDGAMRPRPNRVMGPGRGLQLE